MACICVLLHRRRWMQQYDCGSRWYSHAESFSYAAFLFRFLFYFIFLFLVGSFFFFDEFNFVLSTNFLWFENIFSFFFSFLRSKVPSTDSINEWRFSVSFFVLYGYFHLTVFHMYSPFMQRPIFATVSNTHTHIHTHTHTLICSV